MEPKWIAELPLILVYPNGQRVPGKIAVGLPVQIDAIEANCLVHLDGMDHRPFTMRGNDPLQALLLALRFIGHRFYDFMKDGGRVLDPDEDSDIGLESYFGPLLQELSAVQSAVHDDPRDEPQEQSKE